MVGQLTALERSRTRTAEHREREARELFLVSRALATRTSTTAVLPEIAEVAPACRAASTRSGSRSARTTRASASRRLPASRRRAGGTLHWVLRRMPGDEPAQWVRIHIGGAGPAGLDRAGGGQVVHRVRIEAGRRDARLDLGDAAGGARATRTVGVTRLVSAAADQIGQALAQDRLADEARAAEVARQSDALKSALLQSVSHDLRTPLATIRAAAGTLRPDSDLDEAGRAASADAIEREVARLDRLVANLLDLGRIEAGALRAELDVFELDDLAGRTVDRLAPRLAGHELRVDVAPLPVAVDPVFLDEALTNLLDNALKFAGPGSTIRVSSAARRRPGAPRRSRTAGRACRTTSSSGSSSRSTAARRRSAGAAGHRHRPRGRARAGRGDGRHGPSASRSELGGLAVELDLPRALPADLARRAGRAAAVTARRGATVLVVEDDDETRAVLVRELGSRGYRTQEARRRRGRRSSAGRPAGRTSSCSTSACRTWTGSRSSGGSGARR